MLPPGAAITARLTPKRNSRVSVPRGRQRGRDIGDQVRHAPTAGVKVMPQADEALDRLRVRSRPRVRACRPPGVADRSWDGVRAASRRRAGERGRDAIDAGRLHSGEGGAVGVILDRPGKIDTGDTVQATAETVSDRFGEVLGVMRRHGAASPAAARARSSRAASAARSSGSRNGRATHSGCCR
jgi:hypothetical protein